MPQVWADCRGENPEELAKAAAQYKASALLGKKSPDINTIEDFVEVTVASDAEIMEAVHKYRGKTPWLLLRPENWNIIPAENLIVALQGSGTEVAMYLEDPSFVQTAPATMQYGLPAVVVRSLDVLKATCEAYKPTPKLELVDVEVEEVRQVGLGKRVCVDTILDYDHVRQEGILISPQPYLMILSVGETVENPYVGTRAWRTNSGAKDPLKPLFGPKVLDDIRGGDDVLAVDINGNTRRSHVTSVKKELRAMTFTKVKFRPPEDVDLSKLPTELRKDGRYVTAKIFSQTAETVTLGSRNGRIPTPRVKPGDTLRAFFTPESLGTHFGMRFDEYCVEV